MPRETYASARTRLFAHIAAVRGAFGVYDGERWDWGAIEWVQSLAEVHAPSVPAPRLLMERFRTDR